MYPGVHAQTNPDKPAYLMAATDEVVTYRDLDERSNRLAQLLRARGLQTGDHIALFLENHIRFFEVCWAARRSRLYYTALSSRLTPAEAAYIVNDCEAKVFLTTAAKREAAVEIVPQPPGVHTWLMIDG